MKSVCSQAIVAVHTAHAAKMQCEDKEQVYKSYCSNVSHNFVFVKLENNELFISEINKLSLY